jgi:hypothetical protein
MDMDKMMAQMQQMGGMFSGEKEKKPEEKDTGFKIVKKGKKKKVAGIDAQIWTVESEYEGKKERMDVSVTDDKKVVDAITKYTEVMKSFTQMSGEEEDGLSDLFKIAPGHVVIALDGMKLVKFDDADIPDAVYALPKGMDTGKKVAKSTAVKKPPLCPITGKNGEATQLNKMLKPEVNGWKLIENGTCMNMMKMRMENVIYKKGDAYIYISLSVNVEDEKGVVATYKNNNLKVEDLQRGKIQGHKYQSAYLVKAKQKGMDIRLKNAMLTMYAVGDKKADMASFAKEAFDLSKFTPVKREKAKPKDALKNLGAMFGGKSGSQSDADMKKAGEMLKGLFGK